VKRNNFVLVQYVSQCSAETLFMGGGKINHLLITYSLNNTCAKNYSNRKMPVPVTAKNVENVLQTVYMVVNTFTVSAIMNKC